MHNKTVQVNTRSFITEIPDTCPHCGKHMEAQQMSDIYDSISSTAALIFRCSIDDCHKFFILEYKVLKSAAGILSQVSELINYDYNGFQEPNISKNIRTLSPIFADTFSEASIAESKRLANITGLAFRKSFEFLVKDFAAYQNPEKIEKIRKNSLNNVIDMFYKDMPKIQELLHITRRIGNDETHYYREFTEVDVKDLKKLIYNFSLYIDMILNIDEFSEKTN